MQVRSSKVPVLQFLCNLQVVCDLTFPIFLFVLSLEADCLNMGAYQVSIMPLCFQDLVF